MSIHPGHHDKVIEIVSATHSKTTFFKHFSTLPGVRRDDVHPVFPVFLFGPPSPYLCSVNLFVMAIAFYDSDISSVCFASDLRRIRIEAPGLDSVHLVIKVGSSVVLDNEYYTDDDWLITLYDLDRLLEPCFGNVLKPISPTFLANGTELRFGDSALKVLPCRNAIGIPAAEFVDNFFLTTLRHTKDTAPGRHELLSFYNSGGNAFKVHATYLKDMRLTTRTFAITPCAVGNLMTINVSPSQFADDSKGLLISYVVQCGRRRQQYRVLRNLPAADPSFIFRNCFGAWETVSLTGTKEQAPDVSRSMANAGGKTLLYDVRMVMSYKSLSGKMRHGSVALMNDLALSKSVFLLRDDGTAGDEVVVTDCDLKANYDDELQEVSFTWRRADNHSDRVSSYRPPRIFDRHFSVEFA